ncbi:MAG: cyclic nucleotide-binding domain-containing protein, partial [Betaproteobacteria bacterium]
IVQTAQMGSPYYMSPEQLEGKDLSFHSDMYSLGVVLYELLTGRKPFLAENLPALIDKIIKLPPLAPSEARPELPKELDRLLLRALAKSPAQRYPSWQEFALALSKVGQAVQPRGSSIIADSEKYVVLKSVPMLALLSDAEIWELARAGRWVRVDKARAIVREKERGTSFFFLARGEAKVTLGGRLLNMVGAGEFFGEMAYIAGGEARHATVESHTEALLAEFQPGALEKMSLGAQLQLTRALVRNVSERLALANTRTARA